MNPWSTGRTPEMFAEYAEGGPFYSTHIGVWFTRTFFYFKYVGPPIAELNSTGDR